MFGYARRQTSVIRIVLGVRADGRRVPLTPAHVGGSSNSKQSLHTVLTAVRKGHSPALCREVAQRVSRSPPVEPVVALEVVTERWNTLDALRPDATPLERRLHTRCEVP